MSGKLGIGVVGFGWMGQAHSRSYRRIPMLFDDRLADPELVVCADTSPERRQQALDSFGFREATSDWRKAVEHPDVDIVVVAAPNMFHVELVQAAAAAGKHVFCEKPVGGTPAQTLQASEAARAAGVVTGVGYNYRWAPLVRHAQQLIGDGRLGEIRAYRGQFFSMYGNDPFGLLSWRFLVDQAGFGVTTDLLSHSIDLAHMLIGPIDRVVGTGETFIRERPLPKPGAGTHYDRGQPGDPVGQVTNEDYFSALVVFAGGARGVFETCRTLIGPESRMAFEIYGTQGSLSWNLERMNELQVHLASDDAHTGYTTVFGGERFPYHGRFVPGSANGIGFEDLIAIEAYEFLQAVARGEVFVPGFDEAVAFVSVQDALLRSWESQRWEPVIALGQGGGA